MKRLSNLEYQICLRLSLVVIIFGSGCTVFKSAERRMISSIEGSWENIEKEDDNRHLEHWILVNDSVMIGTGILTHFVDTIFVENLKIMKVDGNWFYVAEVPENPLPVFFKMDNIDKHGFTAVNPHHDFPKNIRYSIQKNLMHAEVSDGKEKVISFDFEKLKD